MKRWLAVIIMIIGIVLLPTYLSANTTQAGEQKLNLSLPFNVPSRWNSADLATRGITWRTGDSYTRFAIQNGEFVATSLNDTWFVYGWFGSLEAILKPYNVKYPQWNNRHNGIDFAGREGLEVISSSRGKVIFAGTLYGNTVVVDAGQGYQITYGHLQDITIRAGEYVTPGRLIGHLGKTGTSNPHLHFQIDRHIGGERIAINPLALLNASWNDVVIPGADANKFYSGSDDPALQSNFAW